MQEAIKKILEIAIHAPSGENCQPWRFEVSGDRVRIFNLPERDNSLYNWGQRASFVAHGALIENITIAAVYFGYRASARLFPDPQDQNFIAIVELEKLSSPVVDPLFSFIDKRITNRKPYQDVPISPKEREEILSASAEIKGPELLLVESKEKIKALARAAAANEEVLFGNKLMHHFFFSHINWTEDEEKQKRIGFYTKELELDPKQLGAFKIFRHWPALKIMNIIGVNKSIAKENAKVYEAASAMGAVVTNSDSPRDFITAGRMLERVWLKITGLGLSFQPLTGILFLKLGLKNGGMDALSQKHIQLVENMYQVMQESFGVDQYKTIAMMFRIGKADAPSARSLRLPLEIN